MKDFSNLVPVPHTDKIKSGLNIVFEKQLQGVEASDIKVDGILERGIIYNHLNVLSESGEFRQLDVRKSVDINRGSYVIYNNENYMVVTDVDDHHVYKNCKITKCNQILKWENPTGSPHEFPCTMSNDSYGAKISSNNDFIANIDTKMKIEIQYNEFTKTIKRDMRFVFNNSEFDIFKVVDITTSVYKGIMALVCQKDLKIAEDDIENNLAWNKKDETIPPPVIIGYNILGDFEISFGKTNEFTIDPLTDDVTWSLEQTFNVCEIVSFTNNTCKVKALIKDEFSTLIASVNGEEIARMDIETMR